MDRHSKDKIIEVLEKKLKIKEAELSDLYEVMDRLNTYVNNLIEDTEAGIRAAMSLNRRFSSRKFPQIDDITFASRYIISTSDHSSYYDLFELPEKSGVGLVLCDSNGYGVSAMLMSIVVSLLETHFVKSPRAFIETVVKDIRNYLKDDKGKTFRAEGKTASILYMIFERQGLNLRYCCVGMPGLIVIRGDERISLTTTPGNIMEDFEVKECSFKLKPGDRVLAPNNGLILARNASNNNFGFEGLNRGLVNAQHLPIADVISNVGFEVDLFIEGKRSRLHCDLAVVGMELERKMLYVV